MMKTKSIILSALLLLGVGAATTSCEDMFTVDSSLVTTDLQPKDTVYQMLGIVKNMQRIMDRSVIFGELRADLVTTGDHTDADLVNIAKFNVSNPANNPYCDPTDFYNVINSCNIYLQYVDKDLKATHGTNGQNYYQKEIIATKCYRAWTYLQLAQIYGANNIPFVTEPVLTASGADDIIADQSNRSTMEGICTYLIDDILPYAQTNKNNDLRPSYSVSFTITSGGTSENISYANFFIPVRLMLAELYLWRGSFTQSVADFREAVRYYHDYLAFTNEPVTTNRGRTQWNETYEYSSSSYDNLFSPTARNNEYVAFIPMDTTAYYGNYSDLRSIFNSKPANNYYPAATLSNRLIEISQAQNYFMFDSTGVNVVREVAPKDESFWRSKWQNNYWIYIGDLRLSSIYRDIQMSREDLNNANLSDRWYINQKYQDITSVRDLQTDQRGGFVGIYRRAIVYLHFAEALNRAGFPESAFTILKYGISTSALKKYAPTEFDDLAQITSRGIDGDATVWDVDDFITRDMVGWNDRNAITQYPIHSNGSGESWYDYTYYIPADSTGYMVVPDSIVLKPTSTAEDTLAHDSINTVREIAIANNIAWRDTQRPAMQAAVAQLILTEQALEGMFEGTRFGDLMRYSKWIGDDGYLGRAVNARGGSLESEGLDLGSESKWYIPLPKR